MKIIFFVFILLGQEYLKYLPNHNITPGDVFNVSYEQISTKGYVDSVKGLSIADKERVFTFHHITSHNPGEYEIDRLISVEIGGNNDIKNLWPQKIHGKWNALMKDELERKLISLVLAKKLDLREAQLAISDNWSWAYRIYVRSDYEKSPYWNK